MSVSQCVSLVPLSLCRISSLHTSLKHAIWGIPHTVMSTGTVVMSKECLMLSTLDVKKSAKVSGDIGDWTLSLEELRALREANMLVVFLRY